MRGKARRRGVTLLEMLIVVGIIALLAGISFPTVTAGLETLRLNSACDSLVAFFNEALSRAERRQEVVEVTVLKAERRLTMHSSRAGFERRLQLPEGITIRSVLPAVSGDADAPRTFALFPGGAAPRFGIEIAGSRSTRRIVRIDSMTGVPRIEKVE
ncbi:MAG TPA: prepilin-type N-terminal cleavage/methylation domain-containing protein [Bryobacteraceae bacterium]|nr:prepilin-type N-terminal cleavage/methylation domain-containing protein [Bryobacteraceae bacterium]